MNHLAVNYSNDSDAEEVPADPRMKTVFKRISKLAGTHFMKTPCNHDFHIGCLLRWISVKMECPTCRQTLPPVA